MTKEVSRFDCWKEKYSFNKCGLNNKEYGSYLSSYLRSQTKPLVLNLNGSWGTGKTHFLKQVYSDLRFEHKYPVIYIDAWKSDFSNDPLLVVISEMIEQFKQLNPMIDAEDKEQKLLKVLGKYSKKLWNVAAIGVGNYASEKFDNATIVDLAKIATFKDEEEVVVGRNLTDNYKNQLSALNDCKLALTHYVNCFPEGKRKVFVLVDELDRCRPTYAIEMLETIKHFFSLDNYIFVVATDTNQLSHSIKAVYGSEFDGTEYLSRFFNRSAALPEPDKGLFAKLLAQDTILKNLKQNIGTFDCLEYSPDYLSRLLNEVSIMYNLSLRRMEQVFRKFESCILYELDTENRYLDSRLLMQLIGEYDSIEFNECYYARKKALTEKYQLSAEFKAKNNIGIDDIVRISTVKYQNELKKLEPDNAQYLDYLRSLYNFSWTFVNEFLSTPQQNQFTVNEGHVALKVLNDNNVANRSRNRQQIQSESDKRVDHALMVFRKLIDKGVGNHRIWTRDDYFKAVELSSTITN
ncbi:P-loop NTPase fold protein [Vibrio pomeroyi]|uniref:KAP family P-loop NTPase fold protein n=1 Tax=Vibrio pomeroyi TaxID=198832 RepID=UPI0035A62C0B